MIIAPISRPPFDPPWMARWSLSVILSEIRNSRGGDEVVENILLLVQHAGAMPVFAKLGAAAQVGHGVNAAMLQPR